MKNNILNIILAGAYGRMGCEIIKISQQQNNNFVIKSGVVRDIITQDKNINLHNSLSKACLELKNRNNTIIIDFSSYKILKQNLETASNYKLPILVGTTGHDNQNLEFMKQISRNIPILYAPNTSLLANLLFYLSKISAKTLPQTPAHILDFHHKNKKDAPSGTAIKISQAISQFNKNNTQTSSVRLGDIVGEHRVIFAHNGERLELSHQVADRRVFAEGALFAGQFIKDQPPGLYTMNHVLDLD